MLRRSGVCGLVVVGALGAQTFERGYVDPKTCQPCHAKIFASFAETGMGRSFGLVGSFPILEDWSARFAHAPSNRVYEVSRRDGRFFMRRTMPGSADAVEKEIHYVIGSGNHSRTYLHRKQNGNLVELPLSWYAEKGGYWAMSPGYDRPDHSDFRREVPDSCMFCHNGYPSTANGGLASGIDCQRCHGPGESHIAGKGAMVNPSRLSAERQMEVCLQCHLESASRTIPDSIRRFNRGPFSYRPAEPLGDFTIYFDAAQREASEAFTVNNSGYGLRQSQCFLKSEGALLCTTCHDPHHAVRGAEAEARYTASCRSCHAKVHPDKSGGCAGCHMLKRRTDDAVHVVMTDHFIRRTPPAADLNAKPEKHGRYSGPVKLSYPGRLANTPLDRVYLAIAALTDSTRLREAARELEEAITAARPEQYESYVRLAEAFQSMGQTEKAIRYYRLALTKNPAYAPSLCALADLLLGGDHAADAVALLEQAGAVSSNDTSLLNGLAVAYGRVSRFGDAETLLRRALTVDDGLPLTWLNLGVCLQAQGHNPQAAEAYRQALRLQPDFRQARDYLKQLAQAIK